MRHIRAMVAKNNAPELHRDYQLDVGKTQVFVAPEGKLEVITSSAATAEGAEVTFVIGDELEHWTPSNGGVELHNTLVDNLTKSGSRFLGTLNAWKPGINSVGETVFDDWVSQESGVTKVKTRILYDARIAPPDTDMSDEEALRAGLEWVYQDCPWADIDAIIARIWRVSAKPDDSKRKYLNWPVASSDSWADPQDWAQMADPTRAVADGEDIVMFFDGSLSSDNTALVGCCMSDGHVFTIGVWEPQGDVMVRSWLMLPLLTILSGLLTIDGMSLRSSPMCVNGRPTPRLCGRRFLPILCRFLRSRRAEVQSLSRGICDRKILNLLRPLSCVRTRSSSIPLPMMATRG
ncbi:hypothetical protein ACQX09_11825, partial [Corynebacterium diphtheriae]